MNFENQKGIFDPNEQETNIIIIGAGSTGSFITLNLAKMGIENIKVIDFDKVEEHNIPNQFYRLQDKDRLKVEALKEIVKDFTGVEIETENIKVDENYTFDVGLNTIIIFCVDNMEARKLIYEKIKELPIILIDTRMGGLGFQIYSIDLSNERQKKKYENNLITTTAETPCGEKSIIFTILNIASETCNIIKKIEKKEKYPTNLKREMNSYIILHN